MRVVNKFAEELPGKGKGDLRSVYVYYVENLQSGDRIYLKRPGSAFQGYYGFDFVICVENNNYAKTDKRKRNNPSHKDITEDLLKKKNENVVMYEKMYKLLRKIYECHDVSEQEINEFKFKNGLPVDQVIKVVKWFFIEQDIRYWNHSGRDMTWGIVPKP
jgi:hypothetical protein